ncbi:hypothetical protein OUZ56_011900 [Daphnia magna]|uniref:Uncharacterized protein n=1 Tax=Daphnia magna TaxID=35525 RepID=A0ABQ9Z1G3_9CRUS|nr:hypothetical protein OUZ56_011900 [Daphnia magna]
MAFKQDETVVDAERTSSWRIFQNWTTEGTGFDESFGSDIVGVFNRGSFELEKDRISQGGVSDVRAVVQVKNPARRNSPDPPEGCMMSE